MTTAEKTSNSTQREDTPNLDRLRELSRRLHRLLSEPEPGLASWHMMLGDTLAEIKEFCP